MHPIVANAIHAKAIIKFLLFNLMPSFWGAPMFVDKICEEVSKNLFYIIMP